MAHNGTLPTESSWEILEEYHIDEEVGFALPYPLVRQGADIWAKIFSYHYSPGQVNFY